MVKRHKNSVFSWFYLFHFNIIGWWMILRMRWWRRWRRRWLHLWQLPSISSTPASTLREKLRYPQCFLAWHTAYLHVRVLFVSRLIRRLKTLWGWRWCFMTYREKKRRWVHISWFSIHVVARCGVQICIMVVYKFVVRLCSLIDVKVCPN